MRRIITGLLLAMFVFTLTVSPAFAGVSELGTGMGQKFLRGAVNTLTGWWEIPAQIAKGYNRGLGESSNKFGGAFVGIFTGIGHAAGRTISGMGDLAGFWAASPKDNENVGTKLDAEYAWQDGTQYDLFSPDFQKATLDPIGNKLLRGLGNGIFGFVEFPGQIVKGVKGKAMDLGIVKGLWYWFSREVGGAYDICSFFLPNPTDTKGLAFDEKWAWSALGDNMNCGKK